MWYADRLQHAPSSYMKHFAHGVGI